MEEAQVIVFRFQLHKGENQLFLDHGPQDAGHLVAVHLHEGGGHFDLFHICLLSAFTGAGLLSRDDRHVSIMRFRPSVYGRTMSAATIF